MITYGLLCAKHLANDFTVTSFILMRTLRQVLLPKRQLYWAIILVLQGFTLENA